MKSTSLFAASLLACGVFSAQAHHSFAAFDTKKTETASGTVRELEWKNPHAWLWVMLSDGSGPPKLWGLEATDVGSLKRGGWTKHTLNPGDHVKVSFHPLLNGQAGGSLLMVTLPSGEVITPYGPATKAGALPPGAPGAGP